MNDRSTFRLLREIISDLFEHRPAIYSIDFLLTLTSHTDLRVFPRLPYHNLGIAHRRLMFHFPDDLAYRETVYPTWLAVVRELLMNVRRHS